MKTYFYLFTIISVFFLSCSSGPKHPQAALNNSTAVNDSLILAYADSLDAQTRSFEQQSSLIYQSADRSMQVDRFSFNGHPVICKAQVSDPGPSEKTSSYYFKNDSLLLVREQVKKVKNQETIFEERRSYLRNGVPFKTEIRQAGSASLLEKAVFHEQQSKGNTYYSSALSELNDALTGTNKFEMVFDEFTDNPEGRFISLKSKLPGVYTANIRVLNTDSFLDSLQHFPGLFKDARLTLKTKITDQESIYVPVER